MNTPASTASAITDEQIRAIHDRHACLPDMIGGAEQWPEILRIARAVLALAAPTTQPTGHELAEQNERDRQQFNAGRQFEAERIAAQRAAVEPSQPAPGADALITLAQAHGLDYTRHSTMLDFANALWRLASRTPAPAAPEDAKDAARYRWLRSKPLDWSVEHHLNGWATNYGRHELDQAIDAAIAASTKVT